MKVIESIIEMKAWSRLSKERGKTIGFIPTMGALHEGHASLIRLAREKADAVVVTIFVNSLQFGPEEDFRRYPRMMVGDCDLLRHLEVDVVFAPKAEEMYGDRFETRVRVSELAQPLCGKYRPGHFEGVATVVLKLLHIVGPHFSVFGDKDYQQRLIIERMVKDLNLDVEIVPAPIVREKDGLALSSRNIYLSAEERRRALSLNRGLKKALELFARGERDARKIIQLVSKMIDKESPSKVDYISICDAETLKAVTTIKQKSLLALAVYFGKTRLIDNALLNPGDPER